jgi:hypothetical protein
MSCAAGILQPWPALTICCYTDTKIRSTSRGSNVLSIVPGLLSFCMPSPPVAARYDAMFPDDPKHQDIKSCARFLRSEAADNYEFRCCCTKPTISA